MKLRILAVFAMAAAVASCSSGQGPDGGEAESSSATPTSKPVVVVLDGSESMLTSDAPGPRIAAAKAAIETFVSELPSGTPFGLVTYGTTKPAKTTPQAEGCTDVTTVMDLAPVDKDRVRQAVSGVNAFGWTPLAQAMEQGARILGSAGTVLVVSDGESTCAPDPCPVAASITANNPDITISTVGFKSSAEQLSCVAKSGNGVFLTADNAAQLAARLGVSRDASAAAERLSSRGLYGIELGAWINDIRGNQPTFPAAPAGSASTFTVRWRDCDFTFTDSMLSSISVTSRSVSTLDGIAVGTPMSRVIELLGDPVQVDEGSRTALFTADSKRGFALKVQFSDGVRTGEVLNFTLCSCLPRNEADVAVQNCGATDGSFRQDVFARAVACPEALRLITTWNRDSRTQAGDKSVVLGNWACSIQGAAEVDRGEPVVRCERADGTGLVTVGPSAEMSAPRATGGPCTAPVKGRPGVVTLSGGSINCDEAQQILRMRNGETSYFQLGNNREPWACASEDVSIEYECYAVNGTDRFR